MKTNQFIYILHDVLTCSWSFYIEIYSKNYFSLESAIKISTFVSLFCCHSLLLLDFHWGRNFGCTYTYKTLDCNFLKEDLKIWLQYCQAIFYKIVKPNRAQVSKRVINENNPYCIPRTKMLKNIMPSTLSDCSLIKWQCCCFF